MRTGVWSQYKLHVRADNSEQRGKFQTYASKSDKQQQGLPAYTKSQRQLKA